MALPMQGDAGRGNDRVYRRIEEWKHRLVDLSRRNRLLFFGRGRGATLQVLEPSADAVFARLTVRGRAWRFWVPAETGEVRVVRSAGQLPTDYEENKELARRQRHFSEIAIAPSRKADELACNISDAAELVRLLKNLHKRSRTDFAERGVRILHLAFGMLSWQERDDMETVRSPLVLVPVELVRESAKHPFELRPVEEDAVLNPALAVKLLNDFGIALPAAPEDWSTRGLREYVDEIDHCVRQQHWSVSSDEVWLALFSFHKLVIFKDLTDNKETIVQHPIVRALAGEPVDAAVRGDVPATEQADRWHHPRDSFLVVDADSSQLACIEAVKRGRSLVLHGPPGTGKSQTITNVIAEFIAAGKTVLFVSEKMAALEVVYRRLTEVNLGAFCLELHSHQANKRAVVQELYRCLEATLQPRESLSAQELETLVRRRQQLCDYVDALHRIREPMARSAFSALAELTALHEVPSVPFEYPEVASLSPSLVARVGELAHRLRPIWHVALEGSSFPWRNCGERAYTAATRSVYEKVLETCRNALWRLAEASRAAAATIGLAECPSTLADCCWLVETLRLLAASPPLEPAWLAAPELDPLVEEARHLQHVTQTYRKLRDDLLLRHGSGFLNLPPDLASEIEVAYRDTVALLRGERTDEGALLAKANEVGKWAGELVGRTEQWEAEGANLAALFGLCDRVLTARRVEELVRLAELCAAEAKPDVTWLEPRRCREVAEELPGLQAAYETYRRNRDSLLTRYTESVFELDLASLVEAFSRKYSSWLRWLRPRFYRDRSAIARCTRDGRIPVTLRDDLVLARETNELRSVLDAKAAQVGALLGAHYRGYDTDFARIGRAIAVATEALDLADRYPLPETLRQQLALDGVVSAEARRVAARLRQDLSESQTTANEIGPLLSIDRLSTSSLPPADTPLAQLREWAAALADAAKRLNDGIQAAARASCGGLPKSIRELLSDLHSLHELRELESVIYSESERLARTFGWRFRGMSTSWEDVLSALEWAERVRQHFAGRRITGSFIRVAVEKPSDVPDADTLDHLLCTAENALRALELKFDQPPALDGVPLRDHWFDRLEDRLSEMHRRIDEIRDWVDFRACRDDFVELGLGHLFERLEEAAPTAEILPRVVYRAILQKWVDYVFEEDASLRRFRGQTHEKLIAEFRELDRRHWQVGAHRVILEANKRRPDVEFLPRDSEVRLLKTEALKRRAHLPVRKLFEKASVAIRLLKPCMLMSPRSVSQFLSPEMTFDLVIFDEASQICTEDAVGAIYRAKQLLVCGDNKQLPPTPFFHSSMSEEFDEDNPGVEENFEPLDSVLDDCLALGMPQGWLRWHYRSRHESLIAFSNNQFYDSRLVTFPSAFQEHQDLGIKLVHVPDGIYDRGGRRDNVREAQVVADLVLEHLQRWQTRKSLGVVAFSQAQMEAIELELERRIKEQSEMERYFASDRLEGFFVKNLENVQGDERDVMIFSVGYGRDRAGRMTMNFGPLNQSGGERRLNVAVTRAREKVVVVSSIRASDIDLTATRAPGVLMLQRYLDYAERGIVALDITNPSGGDFESPFERDVARAVCAMGYSVVPQVGCSGFRIDLGVVDPAQPGRFVLGIECDGASYHSSYVARDKDRLRQEVLERLGWTIHRIWSPDWVRYREREIERLRVAIERARGLQGGAVDQGAKRRNGRSTSDVRAPKVRVTDLTDSDYLVAPPKWARPYDVCSPKARGHFDPYVDMPERLSEQVRLVIKIVAVEGPIHFDLLARRLANAWRVGRVGRRIEAVVRHVVQEAVRSGRIRWQGRFLWPAGPDFRLKVRVPVLGIRETFRPLGHISHEEIGLAMQHIVRAGVRMAAEAVVIEVARVFGFDRTGQRIRKELKKVLRRLLSQGILVEENGLVRLGDAQP